MARKRDSEVDKGNEAPPRDMSTPMTVGIYPDQHRSGALNKVINLPDPEDTLDRVPGGR